MGSLLIVRLTNFLQRRLNPSLIIVQSTAPQICIAQKIADDRAAFILRNSGVNRFKCGNYIWNSFPLPPDTVSGHHLLATGLLLSPALYRHLPFMRQNLAKYAFTGNFSPSSYRPLQILVAMFLTVHRTTESHCSPCTSRVRPSRHIY